MLKVLFLPSLILWTRHITQSVVFSPRQRLHNCIIQDNKSQPVTSATNGLKCTVNHISFILKKKQRYYYVDEREKHSKCWRCLLVTSGIWVHLEEQWQMIDSTVQQCTNIWVKHIPSLQLPVPERFIGTKVWCQCQWVHLLLVLLCSYWCIGLAGRVTRETLPQNKNRMFNNGFLLEIKWF